MATAVNTVESTDTPHISSSLQSWLVVFSAALFFFYEFMILNMFNAINPSLIKEFHISAAELGNLSAYYFYANLCFLFPAGILLDRLSTRKVLLMAMSACVVATYVFSHATAIWVAEVCRFVMGLGSTFCLLSCIRLASRWFPPQRMALVIGLVVTFAMIGGMVSQTPMTVLTDTYGWRQTLFMTAMAGFAMLAVIFLFVRDYPKNSQSRIQEQEAFHSLESMGFWASLRLALMNGQNWLAGLYTSLMNLPIFVLGAMWGSMYLVQVHGLTRSHASWVTTMIFFGTVIGSPLVGWLSDRIGLRRLPMVVCGVLSLVSMLMLMYVPGWSLAALMFWFFAIGLFTSGQIISYPLIAESNPKSITGSASGVASTLIMAGGVSQPIFGWLMGQHWNHKMVNNVPFYSQGDFNHAMLIMPISFVVALLVLFLVKETYCTSQEESN